MECKVMMIDPKTASLWLKKNSKNRPIKREKIKKYANAMQTGKWVLNAETIKFSSEGLLIDGQNRLYAVIKSNTSIYSLVAFDVDDPNAFHTIDTGANRTTYDLGSLRNIKNANIVTGVARILLYWESIKDKELFTFKNDIWKRIENIDVVNYAKDNEDEIRDIYNGVNHSLPYRKCKTGTSLIAALIICNRIDDVATMVFMEGLKTGANLPDNSPIAILRERLIDPPERGGNAWKLELMALVIKSWNKFFKSKTIKTLRWSQNERFPIPGE